MNNFFKHKDIQRFIWGAFGTKSIVDYVIGNEKTAIRVYRGAELNTDHFLLCTKLQVPPRWKNSKKYNKSIIHPK
jgi:hypothetical protein